MTAADLIETLRLPPDTRVDQRVPKTLLVEHGAPTAADRRQVQEGIEELRWVATLKPTTVGVPAYRDAEREYLEIAVLRLTLRGEARQGRLVELVHRAVPYPTVLATEWSAAHEHPSTLSLAHKRAAQREADRVVLDGDIIEVFLEGDTEGDTLRAFVEALPLAKQQRTSMFALYQGWMDAVVALKVSEITGRFVLPEVDDHAGDRRAAFDEVERLDAEIAAVRRAAAKEKQMAQRADLNLELLRLRKAREAALKRL